MRRQDFFDRWHRSTSVLTLFLGSAAVVTILSSMNNLSLIGAALIALLQAIDLIFETRKSADLYSNLRSKYLKLEPSLSALYGLTPKDYKKYKEKIAKIEMDEPPIRRAVLAISQNEAAEVSGYSRKDNPDSFTTLKWYHKVAPHFWLWNPD